MTVKNFIKEQGWQVECDMSTPYRSMDVDISFVNDEGIDDETEFTINPQDVEELDRLYTTFCKENGFPLGTVTWIAIVAVHEEKPEDVNE